jgi:hypothetical protein
MIRKRNRRTAVCRFGLSTIAMTGCGREHGGIFENDDDENRKQKTQREKGTGTGRQRYFSDNTVRRPDSIFRLSNAPPSSKLLPAEPLIFSGPFPKSCRHSNSSSPSLRAGTVTGTGRTLTCRWNESSSPWSLLANWMSRHL